MAIVFIVLHAGNGKARLFHAFQFLPASHLHDNQSVIRQDPGLIQSAKDRHLQVGVIGRVKKDDIETRPLQSKTSYRSQGIRLIYRCLCLQTRMLQILADAGYRSAGIVYKNSPFRIPG